MPLSYNEIKEIVNDIKDDKVMKWPLRIIVIALAIAVCIEIVWYYADRYHHKHSKLFWGMSESNIPPDTIIRSIVRTDTVYRIKYVRAAPQAKNNNTHINNADKVDIH